MNDIKLNVINRLKQDKRVLFIIILGVAGMLLILLSGAGGEKAAEANNNEADVFSVQSRTEKKLETLLESVKGAGKVKVMVTVDSLEEKIYAVNTETESSPDGYSFSDEYVLIEQSGDDGGLVIKVTAPVIRGVGITCEGAESAGVKEEIIRLVSASLGIPVNRIWVTVMQY